MNKGISFYFGYKSNPEERVKLFKKIGFDCVITSADPRFDSQNGSIEEQIKLFRKNKIKLSSLHSTYDSTTLEEFQKKSKIGDEYEKSLINDVLIASKYGFKCVVVHLRGKPNKIGYDRLKRILKVCEDVKIPLAIENINDRNTFIKVFKNIEHPYLKMCYDSGHHFFFDHYYDYFKHFGDKIICLHLHDNNSGSDAHTLNAYGKIDWDNLAKNFAKIPNDINLDYEILLPKPIKENMQEVAAQTYKQACQLEQMIEKYIAENRS